MKINWSLQHKRDTAANWASDNPILLSGQFGIETDTNKLKLGIGANWNSTPYFGGGGTNNLYENQSWFDSNPTHVLDTGQIAFLDQTGRYKLGDGTTQLQSLPFLGSGGGVRFDTNTGGFPAVGTIETVYIAKDTGLLYQWDGVQYTELSASSGNLVDSVNGKVGVVVIDKTDVGLGNVDNTSDANKPVSSATQTALNNKVDKNASITGATKTKVTYDSKGLVTSGTDATTSDIADSASKRYVSDTQISTWNALIGGSVFQTTWNAITNSPSLSSGTGTKGHYYIVSVAGSSNIDGISDWKVGDWAIFDGTVWRKVDNTDAVSSVNGLTGSVSLDTSNVPDTSDKRYSTELEKTKLGFISVTQSVDLDIIESDTITNNAKVTNATHTGEMTGATNLSADKTIITNKAHVAAASTDSLLISDASDNGNLKETTIQDILNLVPSGSTYITGTAIVDFGSENDYAITTVLNSSITNSNIKSISFTPKDTPSTSLDDFSLNGVYFNIENIIDNTSFDIRGTAINNASNNYIINYLIQV